MLVCWIHCSRKGEQMMPIVTTNNWLAQYKKTQGYNGQRIHICRPLKRYFSEATETDIQYYLIHHGLFAPEALTTEDIDAFLAADFWSKSNGIVEKLRNKWNGPDVNIFLFPSNSKNKRIMYDFNGRNGLAFKDKIFLFLTPFTSEQELQALVTHEYSHACRLQLYAREESLHLLDSIILEGIAEVAVQHEVGDAYCAKWTKLYHPEIAKKYWHAVVKPNRRLKKTDEHHEQIMYGLGKYPKWLGYNVGYNIVSDYVDKENIAIEQLLYTSTPLIIKKSPLCK